MSFICGDSSGLDPVKCSVNSRHKKANFRWLLSQGCYGDKIYMGVPKTRDIHHRVGHVFQGRYKGILVEKDSYLLELSRYVVLNPVRAHMVKDVDDWPWSSYHSMVGKLHGQEWLESDWLLSQFSVQRKRAIAKYKDFVRAGVGLPSLWAELIQQIFLGDERFLKKMQKELDKRADLSEIPRAQRRPKAKPLEYYERRYKDQKRGMVEAFHTGDYTMKEISEYFKVHYSTVSRAIKKDEA